MLRAILIFNIGILHRIFNIRSKYNIASTSLLNDYSYRLSSEGGAFRLYLSQLKSGFKKLWGPESIIEYTNNERDAVTAVIYANPGLKDQVIDGYISKLQPGKVKFGLAPDGYILKRSLQKKIAYSFLICFQHGILLVLSLFKKNKKNVYILLSEILEAATIAELLKKEGILFLYTLNSYERYSNLLAVLLEKKGIKIYKICSPSPIKTHYKSVIAYSFIFTSYYQLQEYQLFKKNWMVQNIMIWPVYAFNKYLNIYYGKIPGIECRNYIGFYSSGFSKRLRDHHCLVDGRFVKAELDLIRSLNLFLIKHKQYKLKIYLHPIEKENKEAYDFCRKEYSDLLKDCQERIYFSTIDESTVDTFLTIDTAVSTGSTVNFERIFCGYKTLFAPLGMVPSPFDGTVLENICITNEENFNDKLLESLQLTETEFIIKNRLEGFYYSGVNLKNELAPQ